MHSKGDMREEGVGVGRTKQWGTETLGDLWKGEGWGGEHRVYKMDITGTFRKESREFEGGGFGELTLAHNPIMAIFFSNHHLTLTVNI